MALEGKRLLFVKEYPKDFNAKQAAIRAGYSKKSAESQGSRLLRDAEVSAEIKKAQEKRGAKIDVTVEDIARELKRIAFADLRRVGKWSGSTFDLKESEKLTDDEAAAISEISVDVGRYGTKIRVKLHDKKAALHLLGQHIGMFEGDGGDDNKEPTEVVYRVTGRGERISRKTSDD